jgi:hypothetical protein
MASPNDIRQVAGTATLRHTVSLIVFPEEFDFLFPGSGLDTTLS